MRILTVLTYYYPHWTGLTAYARLLAEGLAERGHQVTVLTARYWNSLPREEVHQGVRIVCLKPWFRLSRGVVMPGFPLAARRLIREHDVVISKGQANYEIMSALRGLYFLLIAKCAIVAEHSETYNGALIFKYNA